MTSDLVLGPSSGTKLLPGYRKEAVMKPTLARLLLSSS